MNNNDLKNNILNRLSYTNRDYDTKLAEILSLFTGDNAITDNWDNMSSSDPLFLILHLMAAHLDILNYQIDFSVLENFMSTAKLRSSIVRIANSFGYKIPSYKSAYARFSISNVDKLTNSNILQSFKTTFVDSQGTTWTYTGDDISIENLKLSGDTSLDLYQGIPMTLKINLDGIDRVNLTHIITNQKIAIGNNKNNKGVSKLVLRRDTQDTNILFEEVDNILTYTGNNKFIYELNVDPQGITYIRFSRELNLDEYTGHSFYFDYLITSGDTPISVGSLVGYIGANDKVELSVIPNSFVKGSNPYTTQEIKEGFIRHYNSNTALITLEDYKNFILNNQKDILDINKILVIDKQDNTNKINYGLSDNFPNLTIGIYLTKKGNILPNESEINALLNTLKEYKLPISININTLTIGSQVYNISQERILLQISNMPTGSIADDIKAYLIDYINNKNIGSTITTSELYQYLLNSKYSNLFNKGISISIKRASDVDFSNTRIQLNFYQAPIISKEDIN